MLEIYLIRHSQTYGNSLKRYIGKTDEPLTEEGIHLAEKAEYPLPEALYVSPLLRCRQTAEILFPGIEQKVIPDFAECDFGDFENKNYKELSGNPDYQKWIDSSGLMAFPNGESNDHFKKRCLQGLRTVVCHAVNQGCRKLAIVVHGGTIMNLMEDLAVEEKPFYDWYVKNCEGYQLTMDLDQYMFSNRCFTKVKKISLPQ